MVAEGYARATFLRRLLFARSRGLGVRIVDLDWVAGLKGERSSDPTELVNRDLSFDWLKRSLACTR